ncbi:MAG: MBL fold metallo-hydrolase [Solirubrobacterales bacterium]|nr:MBL fold metallo-hydrolase [Solirubrobacterales bacterium]
MQPRPIDVLQLGLQRKICCWQIGDLLVDPGPESTLKNVLAALGGQVPRAVLLTHIHLDHAGAAGTLARLYPELQVYVHARGAKHMLDPSKLIASATRIYGEHMDTLWGKFEAVPEDRLHVLEGGETVEGFEVLYTPGHAVHHISYLSPDGQAFVGDVAGTRNELADGVRQSAVVLPPTPPPDIDPPVWQSSIEALRGRDLKRLYYTHYGVAEDVDAHLTQLSERLERWSGWARDYDKDEWCERVRAEMRSAGAGEDEVDYQTGPGALEANYGGLRRFWDKQGAKS